MKFQSPFKSRTENLGIKITPTDFQKIMDGGEKNFHFKWLTDHNFVISLNFSFGSNLIFDANLPNTKSDVIFYGTLSELEEEKTKIKLNSKSKDFLAILFIVLPLLVLCFQMFIGMNFPTFMIAFMFFPLGIIVLLKLFRSEENRLLRFFKEYLNKEIETHYNLE